MAKINAENKKDTVEVRLEYIPGLLTEDVIIGINGVNYQIPRGKKVDLPRFVYAEYERSRKAAEKYYDKQNGMKYIDPIEAKDQTQVLQGAEG